MDHDISIDDELWRQARECVPGEMTDSEVVCARACYVCATKSRHISSRFAPYSFRSSEGCSRYQVTKATPYWNYRPRGSISASPAASSHTCCTGCIGSNVHPCAASPHRILCNCRSARRFPIAITARYSEPTMRLLSEREQKLAKMRSVELRSPLLPMAYSGHRDQRKSAFRSGRQC